MGAQVLRFNGAPTRGYERHVGRRTTARLANDGTGADLAARIDPEAALVVQGKDPRVWTAAESVARRSSARTYALVNEHGRAIAAVLGNVTGVGWPTSGLLGVFLMLPRCRTVRVYEIAPSTTSDRGACHYYEHRPPDGGVLAGGSSANSCQCETPGVHDPHFFWRQNPRACAGPHQCRRERAFLRVAAVNDRAADRGYVDLTVASVSRCVASGKCDPAVPWTALEKDGKATPRKRKRPSGRTRRDINL